MDSTHSVDVSPGITEDDEVAGSASGATDTRTRIVRAALEVFVEKGYGGTRVQDIAERAGLTAGALYVHFPNRSRLLAEAVVLEGDRLIGALITQLGPIEPGNLAVPRLMADQAGQETNVFDRLLLEAFALAARDEAAREQLETALVGLDGSVRSNVEAAVASGAVADDLDVDALTDFFTIWVMGVVTHRGVGRPRPDTEAIFSVCLAMVRGFAPAP